MSKNLSVLLRDPADNTKLVVLGLFVSLLLVAGYIVLVVPNASYVAIWPQDVMALIAASYRTYLGQVPSVDFQSLYGAAVYYPAALGFHLGLNPSAVLNFGQLVVAALLLPLAAIVSYRRLSLLPSIIFLVFLFFLILAPMPPGRLYVDVTLAVFYNRHCWAALAIVLLHYLEPRIVRRADLYVDSAILTLLLLFLFYSKITFAAVAIAFVVANGVTSKWKFQVSALALGVFAAIVGIVEILTQYNSAYLADVTNVVQGNLPSRGMLERYLRTVHSNAWIFVLSFLALAAVLLSGRRKLFDVAFVLGSTAAALWLLDYTGGTTRGLPSLVAVFLVCSELARRTETSVTLSGAPGHWPDNAASLCVLGLLVVFIAGPILGNAKALSIHHRYATRGMETPMAGFSGFVVKQSKRRTLGEVLGNDEAAYGLYAELRRESLAFRALSADEYWSSLVDGVGLLERVALEGRAVVVFCVTDPFSAVLGLRPTAYGFPFLWLGGVFDRDTHPTPERFFSDADYVMVPALPYSQVHLDTIVALYGPYLEAHFDQIEWSPYWGLWARKGEPK